MATSILALVYRDNDFSARDLKPIPTFRAYRLLFRNFWFDSSRDATKALKNVNRVLGSKEVLRNDMSNFVKFKTVCAVEIEALRRASDLVRL